jgi:aminoglycoside 6'-N-acetyltransferase
MQQHIYRFEPMTADDLPLVRRWLMTAHVSEWWGDPPEQLTLVTEDLDEPAMDQYIVVKDNRAFAYLQCYAQTAWPENGLGLHPAGTRGIDQFIGEVDMVGCGHGSAFIRAFTDHLLAAGIPRVITDPDPTNARAVRAYEKAGFHKAHEVDTPDGRALLMVRNA